MFCHRQTTEIIRKNGLIAVEKLDIKGMTTKGLKRKGLNREMLSQQWGLLRNQLQYKAEWGRVGSSWKSIPHIHRRTATSVVPGTDLVAVRRIAAQPVISEWTGTIMQP